MSRSNTDAGCDEYIRYQDVISIFLPNIVGKSVFFFFTLDGRPTTLSFFCCCGS